MRQSLLYIVVVGLVVNLSAQAQAQSFDKATWVNLATQTCIQQAPQNAAVQALSLSAPELRDNCRCVATDMLTVLPLKERQQLLQSMVAKRNLQQIGERLMAKYEVKQAVLACRVATWF